MLVLPRMRKYQRPSSRRKMRSESIAEAPGFESMNSTIERVRRCAYVVMRGKVITRCDGLMKYG